MAYGSIIGKFYKALRARLSRSGVTVNGTAQLPRVQIHSVVEDQPMDKDWNTRSITCTVECLSGERVADVISLLEGNIEQLFAEVGLSVEGYTVIGIVPGQVRLFDEEQQQETQAVFYRCLQDITVFVEKTTNNR